MNPPTHLVLFSEQSDDGWGGPSTFVKQLLEVLEQDHVGVTFVVDGGITDEDRRNLGLKGVKIVLRTSAFSRLRRVVLRLPRPIGYLFEAFLIWIWLSLTAPPNSAVLFSVCSPGRYLNRWSPMRSPIYVFHSAPEGPKHVAAGRLFRFLIPRDAKLVCVSRFTRESIQKSWGLAEDDSRLHVIPNTSIHRALHQEYVAKERKIVLMVGSVNRFKNPWLWLRVAERAFSLTTEDLVFRWVGSGELIEETRAWVRHRGLDNRIEFVGYSSNVPEHYAVARMYLQLSDIENSPLAAIDALASGLPIVISDRGGLGELLDHDSNGWLFDSENFDAAVRCLVANLEDHDLLASQSLRSRNFYLAQFDYSRWKAKYRDVLQIF